MSGQGKINCFADRSWLLILAVLLLSITTTGCRSSYNYASYRAKAEIALEKNNLKKARELYSVIYQQETTSEKLDITRTTWAFYRLGVIAEVSGDVRLAKGYYWGDRIDEGFYQPNPAVDRLAQAGWQTLDEGKPPRTLEEILALEKSGPVQVTNQPTRKKRQVIVPKDTPRSFVPTAPVSSEKGPTKTFQRQLTPPRPGSPEPFRVFY
jgi:hypothetical protein